MARCSDQPVKRVNSCQAESFEASVFLHTVKIRQKKGAATVKSLSRWPQQRSIVFAILLCASLSVSAQQGPLLAAASSLRTLWPELTQRYTADTGNVAPRVSFASSGLLSTQILNGAPFEVFLSADIASIERLSAQSWPDSLRIFARGELYLVVSQTSPLADDLSMASLAAQMRAGDATAAMRLAIPNPQHAPYGRASREALRTAGLWPIPADQLLAAENAAQSLQFVKSRAVAAALVPRALLADEPSGLVYTALPAGSYPKVEHAIVLLKAASPEAQEFYDWLLSSNSAQVLRQGRLSPSENQ